MKPPLRGHSFTHLAGIFPCFTGAEHVACDAAVDSVAVSVGDNRNSHLLQRLRVREAHCKRKHAALVGTALMSGACGVLGDCDCSDEITFIESTYHIFKHCNWCEPPSTTAQPRRSTNASMCVGCSPAVNTWCYWKKRCSPHHRCWLFPIRWSRQWRRLGTCCRWRPNRLVWCSQWRWLLRRASAGICRCPVLRYYSWGGWWFGTHFETPRLGSAAVGRGVRGIRWHRTSWF